MTEVAKEKKGESMELVVCEGLSGNHLFSHLPGTFGTSGHYQGFKSFYCHKKETNIKTKAKKQEIYLVSPQIQKLTLSNSTEWKL